MATANKSLKFFMRPQEEQIVTFTGPESFKDDEGNPIEFEVKVLPQREIDKINNIYRKRSIATDKKGNPIVDGGEVVWRPSATLHVPCGISSWLPCSTRSWTTRP